MKYIYIHGFNSGPESRSGRELEQILGQPVIRIGMDYSRTFDECLAHIYARLQDIYPEKMFRPCEEIEQLCIMGSSLGGFYAMQLRYIGMELVAAWNPVVFPAIQLARFLGPNTRFTDGVQWNFERETLLSYARARDPREWQNSVWTGKYRYVGPPTPRRVVFIGTEDEVLDPALGLSYWGPPTDYGVAVKALPCGHSVPDYAESVDFIMQSYREFQCGAD